jgi:hypothetical protein
MAIIHKTIEANLATQTKSGGNNIYIYIYLLMIHLYCLLPKWNLIQKSGYFFFKISENWWLENMEINFFNLQKILKLAIFRPKKTPYLSLQIDKPLRIL